MMRLLASTIWLAQVAILSSVVSEQETWAQEPPNVAKEQEVEHPKIPDPKGLRKLVPDAEVWFDAKNKQVVVSGVVCQRDTLLEMFACTEGTKEHESIIAVKAKALVVHTALLAAGAKSGKPAHWDPETKKFGSATGDEIDVHIEWLDKAGKPKRSRAQDWVQNAHTKKPMTEPFVFGGSGFHVDETTKRKHYLAEGGSLICVSNFGDAMLDIPVESSATSGELLFAPIPDRIPPQGTRVLLYLKRAEKSGEKKADE